MDPKQEEVILVASLLRHPAAYDVDLFGVLGIRTTDQETIEVEWEHLPDESGRTKSFRSFPKTSLDEAVRFFVDKRYEMELGADIEAALFRARL